MTEAALVLADPSGVIRNWNAGAEALFGHTAQDAVGQTLDLIVPPDYRERHWAGYREAMESADGTNRPWLVQPPGPPPGRNDPADHRQAARHPRQPKPGLAGALAVFTPDDDSAPPLERL